MQISKVPSTSDTPPFHFRSRLRIGWRDFYVLYTSQALMVDRDEERVEHLLVRCICKGDLIATKLKRTALRRF
jgi:hypothetical protein